MIRRQKIQVFAYVILLLCAVTPLPPLATAAAVEFRVDNQLRPSRAALPDLPGEIARPVVAVRNPDGTVVEWVADEVILRPQDDAALQSFLQRYDGRLLHDGSLPAPPAGTPAEQIRTLAPSPYRLVRVNLDRIDVTSLTSDATAVGFNGVFSFSSNDGLKLAALLFRSKLEGVYAVPEIVFAPTLEEHDDGLGRFLDPDGACNPNFPEVCDSTAPATRVNQAWEYIRLLGSLAQPSQVAIVDDGFAVDGNGQTLFGNLDLPNPNTAFRFNFTANSGDVSGIGWGCNPATNSPGRCWHGTAVANVATATANNRYGTAGTGAPVAQPFLLKFSGSRFEAARAFRTAVVWGAEVINASFGSTCDFWCDTFGDSSGEGPEFDAVQDARLARVVVVAAAGNNGTDLDTVYQIPCEINNVVCVGALGGGANAANAATNADWSQGSNFGIPVTLWAPGTNLPVAPLPTFNAAANSWQANNGTGVASLSRFSGTSAAAPFVAGVVGLLKSIAPNLQVSNARQILWDAASHASADPKLALRGSLDAFAAVYQTNGKRPVGVMSSPTANSNWWGNVPLEATLCRGCLTDLSNFGSVSYRARYDKGDGQGRRDYFLQSVNTSPFNVNWNLTGLPRQTGVEVYAEVNPLQGSSITTPLINSIGLNIDSTPPQGQLTSPLPNSAYASSLPLSAQVSDAQSGVDRVAFRVLTNTGWQNVATTGTAANNYTVNWSVATLPSQSVTVAASVFDRQGNVYELTPVNNVRIDRTAPTITMLYPSPDPAAAVWATGNNLTIRSRANDANGIREVRFYAWYREANGAYLRHSIGSDSAPDASGEYTLFWNTASVPEQADRSQPYELYVEAEAVDMAGNSSSIAALGWIVGFDRTLPTVQITSPAAATTYVNGGSSALAVQAGDNLGVNGRVARLTVTARYRDPAATTPTDHTLASLANVSNWSGSLNVAALAEQTFSITAEAFDEAGQRNFISKNIVIDRTAPTATGLSVSPNPFFTNGSRFMSFNYTPSEYCAQASISIFDGQAKLVRSLSYAGVSANPQVASWDGRDFAGGLVASGSYSYRMQLTDQAGNSASVNGGGFSVASDATPPTVSVTLTPAPFRIAADRLLNIRYTVNEAARAEVEVLNSANQVVRYLGAYQVNAGRFNHITWDGRNATGAVVPAPANYSVRIRAADLASNQGIAMASVAVQP
jgi:flagellar hook assembly protein FlgD